MLLHCLWFFSSCCRFLLLIPMANSAAFGWPAVELAGRMPVFEHESMPTASAKEKPFQPNWSASMDHRRKAGGGENAAANLEPQMMGGSSSSWGHSTDEEENAHGQQQKKLPAPVGGEWADPAQGEHKIVHLTSRPTQLYYHNQQEGPELGSSDTVELGTGQVCRVKVSATEVFYIAYEDGVHSRPTVDLFFHCSQYWAWCCGVDCCQVDPSVLLTGLCICILAIAFLVHFCLRSRFGQRFCLDRLFKRRKRVIARANAQRRKRSGDSSQGGEMRRIRTNSLKDNKRGAHKKLARAAGGSASFKEAKVTTATTKTGGAASSKGVPEIVITEPSSCYEPSSKSDYEEDEEDYEY